MRGILSPSNVVPAPKEMFRRTVFSGVRRFSGGPEGDSPDVLPSLFSGVFSLVFRNLKERVPLAADGVDKGYCANRTYFSGGARRSCSGGEAPVIKRERPLRLEWQRDVVRGKDRRVA